MWTRRTFLTSGVGVAGTALAAKLPLALAASGDEQPFSFERLTTFAKELAGNPPRDRPQVPGWLADLDYDAYRSIRFDPDHALWSDTDQPYRLQFFHPGFYYRTPVRISVVRDGVAREVEYAPGMFRFDADLDDSPPPDLGFAGFRVHYPLNSPNVYDELLVFLGASYFRALGRGSRYGLSARGLAINTGLGRPEEFPEFSEFWIEEPTSNGPLVIYALLESESVTGAYRFVVTPAESTVIDVDTSLFFRRSVEVLGIAPLTSMYYFGPNDRTGVDDFRPRVHDSEAFAMWTGDGAALWRPLVNPSELRLSMFRDRDPRGFGLIQRERDFAWFQDLEARYDLRPSLWVEPRGEWGEGAVRLLEIPTRDETNDNIVAFWTPAEPVEEESERRFNYRLLWTRRTPTDPGVARVTSTRIGRPESTGNDEHRLIVVEFEAVSGDLSNLQAHIEASGIETTPAVLHRNEVTGAWRVFFEATPEDSDAELRMWLESAGDRISEIWLYRLDGH